jgi:secreted PhoX family phosphatase
LIIFTLFRKVSKRVVTVVDAGCKKMRILAAARMTIRNASIQTAIVKQKTDCSTFTSCGTIYNW